MKQIHNISVTAHAGALDTRPNTVHSIEAGLQCIKEGIVEVDVRFLPDGTPVMSHDKAGSDATRLEECFVLLQKYPARINLDMKETSHVQRVVELVRQYGLQDRAFMTGIAAGDVPAVRDCGLPYFLNCFPRRYIENPHKVVQKAKDLGAIGLNIPHPICGGRLVKLAHAQGLQVSVWTVDNERAMRRMIGLAVDNITSRRPDLVLEMLDAS